ncbi:MAG: SCO family protein [bacterium]
MQQKRATTLYLLSSVVLAAGISAQEMNSNKQPDILQKVGIDQRLNESIPLDLVFYDESGQAILLQDYFKEKPVILSLVYYECPMLCTMILNGLLRSLNTLKFNVGQEFDVLTVSFDPKETPELAATKKRTYIHKYGRAGAEKGWHFLTGDSASIRKLTEAVGFRYTFDPSTQQYVHASGVMLLTPHGKLSRYFYGIEYSPRDLRLGLIEASSGQIGTPVDQFLLYCYHYDPSQGKYGLAIMNVIRIFGTMTVVVLVSFMILMLRRDKRIKNAQRPVSNSHDDHEKLNRQNNE